MKMKDGSTHLAHKAEHVVDLGEEGHGAILAVVRHDANRGDTQTILESVIEATRHLHQVRDRDETSTGVSRTISEVVTDKGYHSHDVLKDFGELELRTYLSEPDCDGPVMADSGGGRITPLVPGRVRLRIDRVRGVRASDGGGRNCQTFRCIGTRPVEPVPSRRMSCGWSTRA